MQARRKFSRAERWRDQPLTTGVPGLTSGACHKTQSDTFSILFSSAPAHLEHQTEKRQDGVHGLEVFSRRSIAVGDSAKKLGKQNQIKNDW